MVSQITLPVNCQWPWVSFARSSASAYESVTQMSSSGNDESPGKPSIRASDFNHHSDSVQKLWERGDGDPDDDIAGLSPPIIDRETTR